MMAKRKDKPNEDFLDLRVETVFPEGTTPVKRLCFSQPRWRRDPHRVFVADADAVRFPRRFHAVMRFEKRSGTYHADYWFWRAMTPVADGSVELFPMPVKAIAKVLGGCEFQGIGIIDGLWELRMQGPSVGIHPVLPEDLG